MEERGPRFTLLLAVDDATGDVPYALFRPAEDARGYFSLTERGARHRGLPLTLYSDRHGVFLAPAGCRAQRPATQFARAMQELGITQVFARSPQAKGPVERLAGTFQDRLVTELRHVAAATIVEAQTVLQRFLPRFNTRFLVQAAQPESAYRALGTVLDQDAVLAFHHPRTVARDNTVKHRWRTLQLLACSAQLRGGAGRCVERRGGDMSVCHHGEPIATRLTPSPADRLRSARAELGGHPDHELIVTGRGSGDALPSTAVNRTSNGTAPLSAVNEAAMRPPTARQPVRWKATQQSHLQGVSMRAS